MATTHSCRRSPATPLLALALLAFTAVPAAALDTSYPSDGDHPLRIVNYFLTPVGRILEWTVTRPLAVLGSVAQPYEHIDSSPFRGCSRERPARSCTSVVK